MRRFISSFAFLLPFIFSFSPVAYASPSSTFTVTTTKLPTAIPGVRYRTHIRAAGGRPPYRFSATPTRILPGIKLTRSGSLIGRPQTDLRSKVFLVTVEDRENRKRTRRFQLVSNMALIPIPAQISAEEILIDDSQVTKFIFHFLGTYRPQIDFSTYTGSFPPVPSRSGVISVDGVNFGMSISRVIEPGDTLVLYGRGETRLAYSLKCSSFSCQCVEGRDIC